MDMRRTEDLRPHPSNAEIYGDQADVGLIASVSAKGILNPLLITRDCRIISGHRRWDAAKRAQMVSVPIAVFGSDDELDILEALIESNRQRHKDGEQIGKEYEAALWIERQRAEQRRIDALERANEERKRQAQESQNGDEAVVVTLPQPPGEPEESPSKAPSSLPSNEHGTSRDKAGARVGVSGSTGERASRINSVIERLRSEGKTREADQIRRLLKEESINAAWKECQRRGLISSRQRESKPPKSEPKPGAKAPEHVTLAEWRQMDDSGRAAVLLRPRSRSAKFNEQQSNNIEWALWSWNPVTGCLHNCSYCYARDIAARFYPWKFVPAFLPSRLSAPVNTPVPAQAETNIGYKNVFTCSMADLFGKWVPRAWIEAVLAEVADNPQWNFLFLTKFPTRLREFEFPPNAWLGTSVDAQARVRIAEEAFTEVKASVKWLSCEPMLEPLTFSRLDLFHWIVIGGASKSTETPAFRPPREWVEHLERQAREAGCRIYEKENLHPLERLIEYPGFEQRAVVNVAESFKMGYLKRDMERPDEYTSEVLPV